MILATCLLAVCHLSQAQTVDALFKEFKDATNAEYVHLPKILMRLGGKFISNEAEDADDRMIAKLAHRINSLRVLDMDDCSKTVRQRFTHALDRLTTAGYEELIRVNDDGDRVRIISRSKGGRIRELVIIKGGNDDCALVQLKLNINQAELDRLLSAEKGGTAAPAILSAKEKREWALPQKADSTLQCADRILSTK